MKTLARTIAAILLATLGTIASEGQTYRLLTTDNGLTSSLVNIIHEDRYGQIWIASEDGLNRYDGVKITAYRHREADPNSLASNYVSNIIEDAGGNLIVSTYRGLQIYRHDTDDFSPIGTTPDGRKMVVNISLLMLERDGRLYGVGDISCEICALDRDRLEIRPMDKPHFDYSTILGMPAELDARTALRLDENRWLAGTDGDGLKIYDESRKEYADYPLDMPGIGKRQQKVHYLMRDRSGNIWVALYEKGVAMISQHKSMFGYMGSKTSERDIIGSSCVLAIERDSQGGMWVGTDGDGLYHIDGEKSAHITQGIPPIINTILEDSEGTLWTGSYGYACHKREKGRFVRVEGLPAIPHVFSIKEDRQKRVWLGTMDNGLYCYDLRSRRMETIEYPELNRFINCIYVMADGDVLAGTFDGIYNITRREHTCAKKIVYALHQDTRGRLWIGTSDGLVMSDKGRERIYTTADGMPSNTIYAISEDENGTIWLATNAGLSSLDERAGVFANYSARDGLQGNEFSKGAVERDREGNLWFGGHEGITYFAPTSISQINYSLHPRITALYINNTPVNARTTTGGRPVTTCAIYDTRSFSIAYENNSFSIELSAAEIERPSECTFSYSLDGGGWISIPDGGHIVSFSNLESGIHTLEYAIEYSGRRSGAERVEIEIRHPWWRTLWAKIMAVVLLGTIVGLLYRGIRSKEKIKALALISHKIRTPMSLIISPLVELIDHDPDEERQKTYRLMLRNAEKLQHLAAQATSEEPIGPIESKGGEEIEEARMQQSKTTRHIVVVEDDDESRGYLCEQLSADYHVHEATNGREALEIIFRTTPDAIISDVTMPEMDGITLCRKLKKNIQLAHIPVILLTARADEESTLQGLGIGADAYITKPFNIKILRQNILNLIRLRQQLRNTYQGQQLQEDKQKDLEAVDYEDLFMKQLMDCINRHIGDKDLSVETICEEVGISRAQLHRRLKEKTNQSASIFVRNVRLHQAEKLLRESNMRVGEVADMVGFGQVTYFCNAFKELYGVSPTEYRAQEGVS